MKQQRTANLSRLVLCVGVWGAGACSETDTGLAGNTQNLDPVCVAQGSAAPSGSWLCPAPFTLECGSDLPPIYVNDAQNPSCGASVLTADPLVLDAVGQQPVRVRRADRALACETALSIVDNVAPVLTPKTSQLWPPNHKFHTISIEDCVSVVDACDPELRAEFMWASSDEPVDDLGDGHHAPDIMFDSCQRVQVRAERQGPKDGRVYKLGVRVIDRGGHVVDSECSIIVDHDQRGLVGADSGESYRLYANGQNGLPSCDGRPDERPPVPPANPPSTPPDAGTQTPSEDTPSNPPSTPADAGMPDAEPSPDLVI